jgi:hypothetical protein
VRNKQITVDELVHRLSIGAYLSKAIDAGEYDFRVFAQKREGGLIAFSIMSTFPDTFRDTHHYIVDGDSYVVLPDPIVTKVSE